MPPFANDQPAAPPRHLLCVVAARPNFMKMAPLLAALSRLAPAPKLTLLHTGQHYDAVMNSDFFTALDLAPPDINLEVGSGSHAGQTADVMRRFDPVLERLRPDAVLLVGDVNSTLACALVAAKRAIPVLHVEAGLRSGDRSMPEELNRIVTDQLSALLFVSEPAGVTNLAREGIAASAVHLVGNVMIDSLRRQLPHAVPLADILAAAGQPAFLDQASGHAVLTLHRPSNVDAGATLAGLLATVAELSATLPLIFPLHPRTRAMLEQHGLLAMLHQPGLLLLPPLGYLEMLGLMRNATLVLTDSGGVQEETTALGVPCLTLRNNTERPITVELGSNTVVGCERGPILALCRAILAGHGKTGVVPALWDGKAAPRIATIIGAWLGTLPAALAATS